MEQTLRDAINYVDEVSAHVPLAIKSKGRTVRDSLFTALSATQIKKTTKDEFAKLTGKVEAVASADDMVASTMLADDAAWLEATGKHVVDVVMQREHLAVGALAGILAAVCAGLPDPIQAIVHFREAFASAASDIAKPK